MTVLFVPGIGCPPPAALVNVERPVPLTRRSAPTSPRIRGIEPLRKIFRAALLVHRNHAPAVIEPVDPGQGQRIDHKAQRLLGLKIERDGEHGPDGA